MGYNATGHKAFETDGAIGQYLRVALNLNGTVGVAAAADQDIGVVTREAFAAGDVVDVQLISAPGTHYAVASGVIDCGALVYGDDGGKVGEQVTAGGSLRGVAMEAASADGDIIEVMPLH